MDVSGMVLNDPRAAVTGVRFGGTDPDRALLVRFFKQPRNLQHKSDAEGRPIFDSVICIQIDSPGDRTTKVVRRAKLDPEYGNERDDVRFARQWAVFQSQGADVLDGTPLEELRFLTIEVIAEYKASKVQTAEQLAAIADSSLNRLPLGAREHREKARAFIDAALGNAPLLALAGENERIKIDMTAKDALIKDLADRLAALEAERGGKSGKQAA